MTEDMPEERTARADKRERQRDFMDDGFESGSRIQIFRRIGCIGDSLASGEFEYEDGEEKGYWDCYEYSWGKYIERMTGVQITNFSRGGMTAFHMYHEADAGDGPNDDINHLFDPENRKQAYIIALGVNDIKGYDNLNVLYHGRIGGAEDICIEDYHQNKESFVGWYAKIIQRLATAQPGTKFFLMTMPRQETDTGEKEHARAMEEIAGTLPDCYVVDLYHNAPVYDEDFRRKYMPGHMNALGYLFTARLVMQEIDRIIREHEDDFRLVQFIGSAYRPYIPRRKTPIMGWASWNCFRTHISEKKMREQADALVSTGLADCGYIYVNMDDGFFGGRDETGKLRSHPERFPNGIRPVADYAHSLGLKAGIYSEAGDNTCGYYYDGEGKNGAGSGLYGHEEEDLELFFKECGFDFLKVDWCGALHMGLDEKTQYTKIGKIVDRWRVRLNKPLVYNICRWQFPGAWAADTADSWRTGSDITPDFDSILWQIDAIKPLRRFCRPGHVNDLDMMQIGNGLSNEEEKTHFAMWCMMSTPLMLGCNLTKLPEETLSLLKNKDLIALDQDSACLQAYVVKEKRSGDGTLLGEIWVKELGKKDSSDRAVALLNRSEKNLAMAFTPEEAGISGQILKFRDLMEQRELEWNEKEAKLCVTLPPHGIRVYRIEGEGSCEVKEIAPKEWTERPVNIISLQEAQKLSEEGAVLIDVRSKEEYQRSHLEGAINIPYTAIHAEAPHSLKDGTKPLICYCSTGKRSRQAAKSLALLGYESVYCLEHMGSAEKE